MRKILRFYSFFLLLFSVGIATAQTNIHVATAGSLKEQLTEGRDLSHLVISGQLNAIDFETLRQLQGVQYLDLSKVDIVEGGYYIANPYSENKITTQPGVMPAEFFFNSKIKNDIQQIDLPESVKRLESRCLQEGAKLTSITLPEELTYIGELAIGYCSSLEMIDLPASVDSIEASAFQGCKQLQELRLPEALRYIGGCAFAQCTALEEIEIPETVAQLGYAAFRECTSLHSVQLPLLMTEIGAWAFEGCTALEYVTLPYKLHKLGKQAFNGCKALEAVTFNCESLDEIQDETFYECISLKNIQLPAGVKTIGGLAFAKCSALQEAVLPTHLEKIMGGSFAFTALKDVVIPKSCKNIGYGAFANCKDLQSVVLPQGIEVIGEAAFAKNKEVLEGNYEEIKWVIINNPTPPIENKQGEFAGLASLSEIKGIRLIVPKDCKETYSKAAGWKDFPIIEEGLILTTSISTDNPLSKQINALNNKELYTGVVLSGDEKGLDIEHLSALPYLQEIDLSGIQLSDPEDAYSLFKFGHIPHLRKLTLPEDLTLIPSNACFNCSNLESVTASTQLTTIGVAAFSGCRALEAISLPNTLHTLSEDAFSFCTSLRSVTIPESITALPGFTFVDCYKLEKVDLPKQLEEIGEQCFTNCVGLTSIHLPSALSNIGDFAFVGCDNLQEIICDNEEVPQIEETTFEEDHFLNSSLVLRSDDAKKNYQEDPIWQLFKNIKVKADDTHSPAINDAHIEVIGGKGFLSIDVKNSREMVAIYTHDGNCIYKSSLAMGRHTLNLDKGLYIVVVNGSKWKALVY